jgi:hypothetical protein
VEELATVVAEAHAVVAAAVTVNLIKMKRLCDFVAKPFLSPVG